MDIPNVREAALQFAELGIPIVPLHTPTPDGRCSCRNPRCKSVGKHPRHHERDLPNGLSDATTDPNRINVWWNRWPDANLAVITGRESGIVVVDADGEEGVNSVLANTSPEAVSSAIIAKTGNGGYHLYFRYPDNSDVYNRVKVFPGVDIRGTGGYVVAPPSRHASGQTYTWVTTDFPARLADLPTAFVLRNGRPQRDPLTAEDWLERLGEGQRNNELTRRAGKLLAADIPPSVVFTTLLALNLELCDPPLEEDEVAGIVRSVARKDAEQRKKREAERLQEEAQQARIDNKRDFSLLTFAEALRKYGAYEVTWAIPGWLPDSTVGLVVAPPGSFKTWILADLFTAIGSGRKFLGKYAPDTCGPVIMVQQEDFMPMLLNRVCQILGAEAPQETGDGLMVQVHDETLPLYFHDLRQFHIDNPESLNGLRRRIEEIRPSLVVLDPLYSAVDVKDYMSEAAQKLLVLKSLRDEFGCSFMLAHHTTKSRGDGRQRDEAWGSQFLNAWLESGWQLRSADEEGPGSCISVVRHFKVGANPPPLQLDFKIGQYGYEVQATEDPPNDPGTRPDAETAILSALAGGGARSMAQLQRELRFKTMHSVDKVFKKHGVQKVGKIYCLPALNITVEEKK